MPVCLELNLRGVFKSPFPVRAIYFNWASVQIAANYPKDQLYLIQADSPQSVSRISGAVDSMFHNSPEPTRTEAERAFDIDLISMFGNVKVFILSISLAVPVYVVAGLGQHHGHVDSRANPRSGDEAIARICAAPAANLVYRRDHHVGRGWLAFGNAGSVRFSSCSRSFAECRSVCCAAEDSGYYSGCISAAGGTGGSDQRGDCVVSSVTRQPRGWIAACWVSGFYKDDASFHSYTATG